jgi:pimeloyl-ACP methyl ester carboxylesterase
VAVLDAAGVEGAHVFGISMGGMIAQEIAIRAPARMRTLTSIMSTTGARRLPAPTREALAVLNGTLPRDRDGFVRAYVATWRVLAGDGFPFDAARMARHGEESYDRGINPDGAARQLYAILVSGDRTRALRDVGVPTLVVHGTNDPLIPVASGHATARAIPNARLMLVDGMGHTLPAEVWPQLADAIAAHTSAAAGAASREVR